MEQQLLTINIRSRTQTLFKGQAKSVTSENKTGIFDILPFHANFVTLISKYLIIDKGLSTEKKITFESAVLTVNSSNVEVYIGV